VFGQFFAVLFFLLLVYCVLYVLCANVTNTDKGLVKLVFVNLFFSFKISIGAIYGNGNLCCNIVWYISLALPITHKITVGKFQQLF